MSYLHLLKCERLPGFSEEPLMNAVITFDKLEPVTKLPARVGGCVAAFELKSYNASCLDRLANLRIESGRGPSFNSRVGFIDTNVPFEPEISSGTKFSLWQEAPENATVNSQRMFLTVDVPSLSVARTLLEQEVASFTAVSPDFKISYDKLTSNTQQTIRNAAWVNMLRLAARVAQELGVELNMTYHDLPITTCHNFYNCFAADRSHIKFYAGCAEARTNPCIAFGSPSDFAYLCCMNVDARAHRIFSALQKEPSPPRAVLDFMSKFSNISYQGSGAASLTSDTRLKPSAHYVHSQ